MLLQYKSRRQGYRDKGTRLSPCFLSFGKCLRYILCCLVVEGYMVFMEKVTQHSLNPVFISK